MFTGILAELDAPLRARGSDLNGILREACLS